MLYSAPRIRFINGIIKPRGRIIVPIGAEWRSDVICFVPLQEQAVVHLF
ncbi:hypothetical protein [Nostoc sp. DSM 114160]